MKTIGLYEAKTNLSALVCEVETTAQPIALTRHGKVVAEIHPPSPKISRHRGGMKSRNFSIAPDFNEVDAGFDEFFASNPS
ncbi:MAG: type II toxin-antitoxin system Phd/YefM family antitoxin [Luteolibacter sp.]